MVNRRYGCGTRPRPPARAATIRWLAGRVRVALLRAGLHGRRCGGRGRTGRGSPSGRCALARLRTAGATPRYSRRHRRAEPAACRSVRDHEMIPWSVIGRRRRLRASWTPLAVASPHLPRQPIITWPRRAGHAGSMLRTRWSVSTLLLGGGAVDWRAPRGGPIEVGFLPASTAHLGSSPPLRPSPPVRGAVAASSCRSALLTSTAQGPIEDLTVGRLRACAVHFPSSGATLEAYRFTSDTCRSRLSLSVLAGIGVFRRYSRPAPRSAAPPRTPNRVLVGSENGRSARWCG